MSHLNSTGANRWPLTRLFIWLNMKLAQHLGPECLLRRGCMPQPTRTIRELIITMMWVGGGLELNLIFICGLHRKSGLGYTARVRVRARDWRLVGILEVNYANIRLPFRVSCSFAVRHYVALSRPSSIQPKRANSFSVLNVVISTPWLLLISFCHLGGFQVADKSS